MGLHDLWHEERPLDRTRAQMLAVRSRAGSAAADAVESAFPIGDTAKCLAASEAFELLLCLKASRSRNHTDTPRSERDGVPDRLSRLHLFESPLDGDLRSVRVALVPGRGSTSTRLGIAKLERVGATDAIQHARAHYRSSFGDTITIRIALCSTELPERRREGVLCRPQGGLGAESLGPECRACEGWAPIDRQRASEKHGRYT